MEYKMFQPTATGHELRNLILITDHNLGRVMDHINKFLRRPNIVRLRYTDEVDGKVVPKYNPYYGVCDYHWMYKKYLKGEASAYCHNNPDSISRLAICSKYEQSCIPIELGDRYKIYGDKLVIYHRYDPFVLRTPWTRYVELRSNSTQFDPAAYAYYKINGFLYNLFDPVYDYKQSIAHRLGAYESFDKPAIYYDLEDLVEAIANRTHYELDTAIQQHTQDAECSVTIQFCNKLSNTTGSLTATINPKLILDQYDLTSGAISFTVDDQKNVCFMEALRYLVEPEVTKAIKKINFEDQYSGSEYDAWWNE